MDCQCSRRDHPRSRGVYAATPRIAARMVGSSPLARGLQLLSRNGVINMGIIPARAGFTPSQSIPKLTDRDHPRSRGVYINNVAVLINGGGSSPLARGLQAAHENARDHAGIIPARAGFTVSKSGSNLILQDHPRSRGVYQDYPRDRMRKTGSSPLARGLLRREGRDRQRQGIIPARAGFTG